MNDINNLYLLYQNERPMVVITKDAFISLIEAVRLQTLKDRSNAIALSEMFNSDGMNPYDNSILVKAIISFLQLQFPKKDGHCDIEHYMFDMNFGKMGDQELITPEDLWFQLNQHGLEAVITWKNTKFEAYNGRALNSTHSLIDEVGHFDQSYLNQLQKK